MTPTEVAPADQALEGIMLEEWVREELQCEGKWHPGGGIGHVPHAPAEYRLVTPCCRSGLNQCRGRVGRLLADQFILCGMCGARFPTSELGVVPI